MIFLNCISQREEEEGGVIQHKQKNYTQVACSTRLSLNSFIVTTIFASVLRILFRVKNGENSCGMSLRVEDVLVQVNLMF